MEAKRMNNDMTPFAVTGGAHQQTYQTRKEVNHLISFYMLTKNCEVLILVAFANMVVSTTKQTKDSQ